LNRSIIFVSIAVVRIRSYLEESPVFAITKAARVLEASLNRALRGEDLTFLQGLVLVAVFFEDPVLANPSQLADSFSTTRGNMSHCLSSLEARGLLKRQIDPGDARVFRIAIRPDGKKRAMRLIRTFDGIQNRMEREFGAKDVRQTLANIVRIEALCLELAARQTTAANPSRPMAVPSPGARVRD
jgi:DNA-binding MarR family transcriptional regulator